MKENSYSSVKTSDDEISVDTNYAAYIIMFYEGVGNLFPWNAFITAAAYYATRFCGSPFAGNFENYFSFVYTFSQTVGLALSVKYQNSLSLRSKVVWPLLFYSFVFVVTTTLVTVEVEANLLFWVTLISTFICGVCGAILSGGLFGFAAVFPASYTGALMNGQALAGLIVAVSDVVTTLAAGSGTFCDAVTDETTQCQKFSINFSALAYFIIATMIMLSCVASFLALQKLPYTKYVIRHGTMGMTSDDATATTEAQPSLCRVTQPLLNLADEDSDVAVVVHLPSPAAAGVGPGAIPISSNSSPLHVQGSVLAPNTGPADDVEVASHCSLVTEDASLSSKITAGVSFDTIWKVLRQVVVPAASVTLTFTITIGIFPSLIVLLESFEKCKSSQKFFNEIFVPFQFLLFNLFDFCGRVTAGAFPPIFTAKNIWMPAISRLIFFPLFLLCHVKDSQLPVVFNSDVFPILFMALFAFTNGYVASACMMIGPSLVRPSDAPLAGTIMIFSLTIGLLFGACTSFLTVFISQGQF